MIKLTDMENGMVMIRHLFWLLDIFLHHRHHHYIKGGNIFQRVNPSDSRNAEQSAQQWRECWTHFTVRYLKSEKQMNNERNSNIYCLLALILVSNISYKKIAGSQGAKRSPTFTIIISNFVRLLFAADKRVYTSFLSQFSSDYSSLLWLKWWKIMIIHCRVIITKDNCYKNID